MKRFFLLSCLLFALFFVSSCGDGDEYLPNDGTESLVGESENASCDVLGGHKLYYIWDRSAHWQRCSREGCTYRTVPVAHSGGQATCEKSAKCASCGLYYGEAAGHNYVDMTDGCIRYDECSVCKNTVIKERHLLAYDGRTCSKCNGDYFLLMLEYTLSEDGKSYIVSSGKYCEAETVRIPAEYKGLPVTEIGKNAFSYNEFVKTVIFPSTVEVLGFEAFAYTPQLTTLDLPNGLKRIEEFAFSASAIQSIVIPDSVEYLGAGAFAEAEALESVVIGSGVKVLSDVVFSCTGLKTISIPPTVEVIERGAFSGCRSLEIVEIKDGVKRIEASTFDGCDAIQSIVLPNTLEYIHATVFGNGRPNIKCHYYRNMKYLGTNTNPHFLLIGSIGVKQLVPHPDTEMILSQAFFNVEDIVSVEIGSKVRSIGEGAFSGMDALESITVDPRNVYYYAINNILVDKVTGKLLQGCKTSVIPNDGSITELDLDIFSYIGTIETIYVPKGIKALYLGFANLAGLKQFIIESDVGTILISGNDCGCNNDPPCFTVYHCHTEAQWESVVIEYAYNGDPGVMPFSCYDLHATHYFYSEEPPTEEGNYWHFVDGVPTPW